MDGPLGPRWRKSNMILFKSCNTDLFLHYCVSRGLIHIANRYIGDSALPTRSKTDIIILFCGRKFRGEEHFTGKNITREENVVKFHSQGIFISREENFAQNPNSRI